mmetsp:Transcript_87360/g.152054  ORF Transcript_87360/g.152054 Transcript_87360/m.152054 type:complete len:83 (+) Transcript_87360:384-632(+)
MVFCAKQYFDTPLFHGMLCTLLAPVALEMESQSPGDAQDHDELFVDDFYDAATDDTLFVNSVFSRGLEAHVLHFWAGLAGPS